jgi:hypothetical protein
MSDTPSSAFGRFYLAEQPAGFGFSGTHVALRCLATGVVVARFNTRVEAIVYAAQRNPEQRIGCQCCGELYGEKRRPASADSTLCFKCWSTAADIWKRLGPKVEAAKKAGR